MKLEIERLLGAGSQFRFRTSLLAVLHIEHLICVYTGRKATQINAEQRKFDVINNLWNCFQLVANFVFEWLTYFKQVS